MGIKEAGLSMISLKKTKLSLTKKPKTKTKSMFAKHLDEFSAKGRKLKLLRCKRRKALFTVKVLSVGEKTIYELNSSLKLDDNLKVYIEDRHLVFKFVHCRKVFAKTLRRDNSTVQIKRYYLGAGINKIEKRKVRRKMFVTVYKEVKNEKE